MQPQLSLQLLPSYNPSSARRTVRTVSVKKLPLALAPASPTSIPLSRCPDTGSFRVRNGSRVPGMNEGSRAVHSPPIPTSLAPPGLSVLQSHPEVSPG